MTTRKKLVIINAGALVGIIISLFTIPPRTPLWMWAAISTIVVGVLNYAVLTRTPKLAETNRRNSTWIAVAIFFGFGLLMFELALHFLHH
jgi:hypothetical protein